MLLSPEPQDFIASSGLSPRVTRKPDWQWVTGEPTHYQYWRPGEGTGWFDQSFTAFLLDKDQWDDWHGHAKMRFICEWE